MRYFGQRYGDYERATGQSPGLGEFSVLALNVKSTSWTGGLLQRVSPVAAPVQNTLIAPAREARLYWDAPTIRRGKPAICHSDR